MFRLMGFLRFAWHLPFHTQLNRSIFPKYTIYIYSTYSWQVLHSCEIFLLFPPLTTVFICLQSLSLTVFLRACREPHPWTDTYQVQMRLHKLYRIWLSHLALSKIWVSVSLYCNKLKRMKILSSFWATDLYLILDLVWMQTTHRTTMQLDSEEIYHSHFTLILYWIDYQDLRVVWVLLRDQVRWEMHSGDFKLKPHQLHRPLLSQDSMELGPQMHVPDPGCLSANWTRTSLSKTSRWSSFYPWSCWQIVLHLNFHLTHNDSHLTTLIFQDVCWQIEWTHHRERH